MGIPDVGVLLDSVIVIDHLNGIPAATEYLGRLGPNAAVSVITRAEVLTGYDEAERGPIAQLLDAYLNLGIDAEVADRAARLRRANGWKLPDAFQAAIAELRDLRLATRNTHDFPPERFPFVVVPYRI